MLHIEKLSIHLDIIASVCDAYLWDVNNKSTISCMYIRLLCCFSVIIACPCIRKKAKENGGDRDVIYEDPEKNNDTIKMQSSPAYQTVSSVCGTNDDCYYSGMTDDVKMEPSPAYQTVS